MQQRVAPSKTRNFFTDETVRPNFIKSIIELFFPPNPFRPLANTPPEGITLKVRQELDARKGESSTGARSRLRRRRCYRLVSMMRTKLPRYFTVGATSTMGQPAANAWGSWFFFLSLSLFPPHPRATDSRKNLVNSCASNRSVAEEGWCSRTIHKFAIVSRSIRGILFWREPPGAARGFPRFFEFRARKLRSYANHGPQIRDSQIVSPSSNARLTFNVT